MPANWRNSIVAFSKFFPGQPVNTVVDFSHPDIRCAVWQLESTPTNNLPHLQGAVYFTKQVTSAGFFKRLPDLLDSHIEPKKEKASWADNVRYCTKVETRIEGEDSGPFFYPTEDSVRAELGQGSRTDLSSAVAAIQQGGIKRAIELHPTTFIKFHAGMQKYAAAVKPKPVPRIVFKPRPWQRKLLAFLKMPADDRHILWVHDPVGNVGKSVLTRHLVLSCGAIKLEGRVVDMAYAYSDESIAVFDIPRTMADYLKHLYGFAEGLKNGMVNSTKYEPTLKIFDPPHVVFFSNSGYDPELWSQDRVIKINADHEDFDELTYQDYPARYREALHAIDNLEE